MLALVALSAILAVAKLLSSSAIEALVALSAKLAVASLLKVVARAATEALSACKARDAVAR